MGLFVAWRKFEDKNPIKNGICVSRISKISIPIEFFLLKIEQKIIKLLHILTSLGYKNPINNGIFDQFEK